MIPSIRVLTLFLIASLSGCDFSGTINARSGTLDNDYVEEPLAYGVEKYEKALVTSNNILSLISKSEYPDLHKIYFSEAMKAQMTSKDFENSMIQVREKYGPIKAYKSMQWNFSSGKENGMNLLYSVKIVEHEKTMMNYIFVFEKDKPYLNVVGISVKQR